MNQKMNQKRLNHGRNIWILILMKLVEIKLRKSQMISKKRRNSRLMRRNSRLMRRK